MALVFILQTNADFCSPWSLFWSGLTNYLVRLALSRAQQCFEKIDRVIHSGSTYILMSVHSRIFISLIADSRDLFLSLLHFFFQYRAWKQSQTSHLGILFLFSNDEKRYLGSSPRNSQLPFACLPKMHCQSVIFRGAMGRSGVKTSHVILRTGTLEMENFKFLLLRHHDKKKKNSAVPW